MRCETVDPWMRREHIRAFERDIRARTYLEESARRKAGRGGRLALAALAVAAAAVLVGLLLH